MRRLLLACLSAVGLNSLIGAQTPLTAVPVASGFSGPLYATAAPGDPSRLYVVEQSTGLIRIVRNGAVLPTPFLDVRSRILAGGERGLLGLAFHPDYARTGYLYVDYTRVGDGATIVERFTVSAANPDRADPASGTIMLGPISQPYSNHNGGCLQFGPDGYLYVSTGDGGSGGDPGCRAQSGATLLGKLLRIDVDSPTSRIPPSNPFVGNPAFLDEIWAYGLRNPWRFSFDRLTGDLWIGDVGQNAVEEVDFQPGSSAGGENYGWKIMEGNTCYSSAACPSGVPVCNAPSLTPPVLTYTHTFGCAITGGYVYRGCGIPDLRGTYFYADYCSGRIWSFRYDGTTVSRFTERTAELAPAAGSISSIASFGEDHDGELLIVSATGTVWKVVARGSDPSVDLGFGTAGGNARIPQLAFCGRLDPRATGELRVSDAAPNAPAAFLFSDRNTPTPIPGIGTLVPYPVAFGVAFGTDANGFFATLLQRAGPATVAYVQCAIVDAGAPGGGIALTNALQITIP